MEHSKWTLFDLSWACCQWTCAQHFHIHIVGFNFAGEQTLFSCIFVPKVSIQKKNILWTKWLQFARTKAETLILTCAHSHTANADENCTKLIRFFLSSERLETSNSIQFICNKIFLHRLCILSALIELHRRRDSCVRFAMGKMERAAGIGSSRRTGLLAGAIKCKRSHTAIHIVESELVPGAGIAFASINWNELHRRNECFHLLAAKYFPLCVMLDVAGTSTGSLVQFQSLNHSCRDMENMMESLCNHGAKCALIGGSVNGNVSL